jgi:hypothetical protein
MGGKSGQTIGYHYLFSLLFGLGRGPINQLKTIMVADKIAWEGEGCNDAGFGIRKPELFGGEKKEGGVQGPFAIFFGADDQVLPGVLTADCGGGGPMSGSRKLPNVKTTIGGLISEMRGTTMVWFDGLITSMNPYPKPWSFRVRRYSAGWYNDECFYPAKSVIFLADGKIHAMNPAHIIYQCLTDPVWGRGLPKALINENSFIYAANVLCAEGFGLCMAWQRKEEVDQFIAIVQDYIDAAIYPDPETGKMTIKLLRDDYDSADLPLYTKSSGLLDITEDDASSQDDIFNEMIGQGFDPITKEPFTVRVHNLAARQSMGAPNPEQRDCSGIATRALLGRVLQRDLKKFCSGLKKYVVVLDRSGWKIRPGMPFRVSEPRRGIGQVVLRAVEIVDQSFKDGQITIKCTEDVFGLPDTAYVTSGGSSWTPAATAALPATEEAIYEANYRDIVRRRSVADAQALAPEASIIGTVAISPDPVMYQYDLLSRATGEPDFFSTSGSFTGAATLVDAITPLQTIFEITGETSWTDDIVDQAIAVGSEQMGVVAYDPTTHMLTVERGVADTIPRAHAAAATVWTIDDDLVSDGRTYAAGETVEAKVLTRTGSDLLDPAAATLMTLDVVGRQALPYPPGDVKVDGDSIYALSGLYAAPVFTWAHRDRWLQEDQLVGHTEASVGPEAGQSYVLRIYGADGITLLRTEPVVGTTFTYDAAMQLADGSPGVIFVELESVRDGLTSYQHYRFGVPIVSGYGFSYGFDYGGS